MIEYSNSFQTLFIVHTGPGESCEGETSITFDIENYYTTTKTYDSTGNAPIVQSTDCAPGLSCIGAKCTDCKQTITTDFKNLDS